MKGSSHIVFAVAVVSSLALGGCLDGFDTDKIDSELEISPSLMLPMSTSSTSIEYLFDEKNGYIEYYVADDEDGTNRIRLRGDHRRSVAVPLLEVLGLGGERGFSLGQLYLSYVDFDVLAAAGQSSVSESFTADVPLADGGDATIYSIDAGLSVSASWSGFSHPMALGLSIGGESFSFDISTSEGSKTLSSSASLAPSGGKLPVSIVCEASCDGGGSWGTLDLSFTLSDVDNVVCSMKPTKSFVGPNVEATNLGAFKTISKSLYFENPRLWLTCENNTALDITIEPEVTSAMVGGTVLTTDPFPVGHNSSDEYELNRSNSAIAEMLRPVPENLYYISDFTLSMPAGVDRVRVTRGDTAYLGFRYDVPFDFIMEGNLSESNVTVSDIPENSHISAAKLIITSDNSMPFSLSLAATLIEKGTGDTLSTISAENIIDLPQLTEWGTSTGDMTHKVTTVLLTEENIADLQNAESIYFVSNATSAGLYVAPKLEDKANIDIALAVQFEFTNK